MRCERCLLRECLCAQIPRIETRTRVVIVRHVAERFRSSNTGRLAALALARGEIVDHGTGADVAIDRGGAWLLWPEGPPVVVPPTPPPERLIVIDATWHQARRMRQRLPALRGLPIISLSVDEVPADRLRESPGRGRVSTIEAIARALRLLEGDSPAEALEALFALHVQRARSHGRRRV
jgi:DTW domain-containing protein YfiP